MNGRRSLQLIIASSVLRETPRHRLVHRVEARTVALGPFADDIDSDFVELDADFAAGGRAGHLHVMRDEGEHALRAPDDPRPMKLRAVFGEFLNDDGASVPLVTHGRGELLLAIGINLPSHVALDPVEQCRRRCGVAELRPLAVSLVVDRGRLESALTTKRARRLDVWLLQTAALPKLDRFVALKPAGEPGLLEISE